MTQFTSLQGAKDERASLRVYIGYSNKPAQHTGLPRVVCIKRINVFKGIVRNTVVL